MYELIKELDYFGYTPQFLISGENKFKTKLGGFIFLLFAMFGVFYAGKEFINFLSMQTIVDSSRDLLKASGNFTLNTDNLYFGIGLIDNDYKELNMTNHTYLNFTLEIISISQYGIQNKIQLSLSSCNLSLFIDEENSKVYSKEEITNLKDKLNYYLCIDSNFSMNIIPKVFSKAQIFLQFRTDLTNLSNLEDSKFQINDKKPKINFIYRNIYIDTENKTYPFNQYIDSYWSGIDFENSKKTEFSIDPYEMLDDNNPMGNSVYSITRSKISSNQVNGTVFPISIKTNRFDNYLNRTEKPLWANGRPVLAISRAMIYLNPILVQTQRNYKKFASFLAEITSILSNLLMIFAIILMKYNSVQGMNNMILSLYTHESIQNLKFFKDDLKPIFQFRKIPNSQRKGIDLSRESMINASRSHDQIKNLIDETQKTSIIKHKIGRSLFLENVGNNKPEEINRGNTISASYNQIKSKSQEKQNNINESIMINKLDLPTDRMNKVKVISEQSKTPLSKELNQEDNIKIGRQGNFILEDLMSNLLEDKVKFSFTDHIKSMFYPKSKRNTMYLNAIENLKLMMDIDKYLKFHLDMTLVKEVLFDDTQINVFDTVSKLINLKRLFEKNEESDINFSRYRKEDFEDCFNAIRKMRLRNSSTDKKIINFIEKRLDH